MLYNRLERSILTTICIKRKKNMDVEKRENTKELDDLISNAMEIADVITMQKILAQKHLKYDKSITKLDDLKSVLMRK